MSPARCAPALNQMTREYMNTTRPSLHGCRLHSIRVCCGLPTAAAPGHDDENGRPLSVDLRPVRQVHHPGVKWRLTAVALSER